MDKKKQSIDQNVLARNSNKNQVKNATNVDEERMMKNKSWNESPAISKESQISDRKVVTRIQLKKTEQTRQDNPQKSKLLQNSKLKNCKQKKRRDQLWTEGNRGVIKTYWPERVTKTRSKMQPRSTKKYGWKTRAETSHWQSARNFKWVIRR